MAPPVWDADRHGKKERPQKIRGISARERQAENSSSQEAQVVADDGLAMRTVRRDAGTSPLEPAGVHLYQQLPLMAAAVERVMAAHASALLTRRSRLLAVLTRFQQACEP